MGRAGRHRGGGFLRAKRAENEAKRNAGAACIRWGTPSTLRPMRSLSATGVLVAALSSMLFLGSTVGLTGCGDDDDGGAATPSTAGSAGAAGSEAGGSNAGGSDAGGSDAGGSDAGGSGGGTITPVPGPENTATSYKGWDWVPVQGSLCRNYTETGIAISAGSGENKDKVLYFVEGGNACFNALTCQITAHPEGFGTPQFKAYADQYEHAGVLDRADPNNPFKDWTYVGIPYCSGDVFAGNAADVEIDGTKYVFQGYKNMGLFLDAAKAKLPDTKQVVFSGVSAGGFGTAFNFERVAAAFDPMPVTVIDDSGPPMGPDYLVPCLQKKFDAIWNMSSNLPADCADCKKADGSFIAPFMAHVLKKRENLRFGLISSQADGTISSFWSFGNSDCANDFPGVFGADKYQAGLVDLRDNVLASAPNARVFYVSGNAHVWLVPNSSGARSVADVKAGEATLADWLTGAIDGGDKWKNQSVF